MTLEGDSPAVPTKRESPSLFWPTIAVIMTTVTRTLIMPSPIDLTIYRDCVRAMLDDPRTLYTASSVSGLGFTYPPFAAIALIPLALIPSLTVTVLHYAVSAIAIVVMIDLIWQRCGHTSRPFLTAVLVGVLNFSEPIGKTFVYGQVNLQLALLVIVDVFLLPRKWRGVGVGVATGFKLTPGIFALWYLVTGQFKAALRAAAAGLATIAIGFAAMPTASWEYWTHLSLIHI